MIKNQHFFEILIRECSIRKSVIIYNYLDIRTYFIQIYILIIKKLLFSDLNL